MKRAVPGPVIDTGAFEWRFYRKKPVVVRAAVITEEIEIETMEGTMLGKVGDYLIEGVHGELYPCDPEIFAKTYDSMGYHDVDKFYEG